MDDQSQRAFEFAQDTVKQVIALSTGIMALTITFQKDFIHSSSNIAGPFIMLSWIFFLISVSFGLWTLCALTGRLGSEGTSECTAGSPIYDKAITNPAMLQLACFFVGLVCTVLFGIIAVLSTPAT